MDKIDTQKKLIENLKKIYDSCTSEVKQETDPDEKQLKAAYAKGVARALEVAGLYVEQSMEELNSVQDQEDASEETLLHKMSALEVVKISLETPEQFEHLSIDHLAEAAFTFENEHMASLGDLNVIGYETYTSMSPAELIKIIKQSVQEICRINDTE